MTDKPTAWWHNVQGTEWHLLSKGGTLGQVSEHNNNPLGDAWNWNVLSGRMVRGTAKSGEEARAAVSRELARRKEGK